MDTMIPVYGSGALLLIAASGVTMVVIALGVWAIG